jgi:hypothetical protein
VYFLLLFAILKTSELSQVQDVAYVTIDEHNYYGGGLAKEYAHLDQEAIMKLKIA